MTFHHWKTHWHRKCSSRCKESEDPKIELNSTDKTTSLIYIKRSLQGTGKDATEC